MAFPLTHLLVANHILQNSATKNPEQFLLGSISPDAVHYRKDFLGAEMANIGPTKKISHLCPISEEKWGQVTDNKGWEKIVRKFVQAHKNDPSYLGYATHVLTDIYNNTTLWSRFIKKYPQEAAKGYASDYYRDMRNIDTQLYYNLYKASNIPKLLALSTPKDMPELVSAEEIAAIKHNLLYEQYNSYAEEIPPHEEYTYVSYDDVMGFIEGASAFCLNVIANCPSIKCLAKELF